MTKHKNLFVSILTRAMPAANYRGEAEANRTVLQKITMPDGSQRCVVSPDAIRNALREMLAAEGLPMRRSRVHDGNELTVRYCDQPNPDKYADDFIFGYMVPEKREAKGEGEDKKGKIAKKVTNGHPARRVSILRMNFAVATTPYMDDATLHQSPRQEGASMDNGGSALLHREVSFTSFQYCFAIDLAQAQTPDQKGWITTLLTCIANLANVSGSHARSYFDFSPRAAVARLTSRPAPGFGLYDFREDGTWAGELPPGCSADEFFAVGPIPGVRSFPSAEFMFGSVANAAALVGV